MSTLAVQPSHQTRASEPGFPAQPLAHLDVLWIQVAGTLCNLSCAHCFVSAGPTNAHHRLMTRHEVRERVAEGLALGVKELYFTGGEPFLHPELLGILADSLEGTPCTVLTNGTRFTASALAGLRDLTASARYSLELRISLDGVSPEEHDSFRGAGAFARVIDSLRRCEAHGLLPIVTVTQTTDEDPLAFRARCVELLRSHGVTRPRLKLIPMFRLGREAQRTHGYVAAETLAGMPATEFDPGRLQCSSCRAVSARGVYVCPLLVEEPGGRMGDALSESLGSFQLEHGACYTCWVTGMTCGNG